MVITELPKRRAGVVLTKDPPYSQKPLVLSRDSFGGHIVAKLYILQGSAQHGQAMSWGQKPRSHSVVIHNFFFVRAPSTTNLQIWCALVPPNSRKLLSKETAFRIQARAS